MEPTGRRAVVLGAGIAGLVAAAVLSESCRSVTVLERDSLPDGPDHRRGVPQGRHLHHLSTRGVAALGQILPGLPEELSAAGAATLDDGDLSRLHVRFGRHRFCGTGTASDAAALTLRQSTRPFLEFHIRRRVAALNNVTIRDETETAEPILRDDTVTGVRTVAVTSGASTIVGADLVIDATGRGARTVALLEQLGYAPPPVEEIRGRWAYSSQMLRIPPGRITERLAFVVPGGNEPSALLVACEHDTWVLAIARSVEAGPPPDNLAGLLSAAEALYPAQIASGLRDGHPLGGISRSHDSGTRWRRYDRAQRRPGGLLVIGDALCRLNPLHGQGMTMAALQALALRDCLRGGDEDLSGRFYSATTDLIKPVLAMNRAADQSADAAKSWRDRMRGAMISATLRAAGNDPQVAERLLRVRNLVDPPQSLRTPSALARVLRANLRRPGVASAAGSTAKPDPMGDRDAEPVLP